MREYIGLAIIYNILTIFLCGLLGLLFLEHNKLYYIFPEYWQVALAMTGIVFVILKAIYAFLFKSSILYYADLYHITEGNDDL